MELEPPGGFYLRVSRTAVLALTILWLLRDGNFQDRVNEVIVTGANVVGGGLRGVEDAWCQLGLANAPWSWLTGWPAICLFW
jgi:hypothetical protein